MKKEDTHVELHDTHTKIKKLMDEIRNLYNIYILAAKPKAAEAKSQKKPNARSQKPAKKCKEINAKKYPSMKKNSIYINVNV